MVDVSILPRVQCVQWLTHACMSRSVTGSSPHIPKPTGDFGALWYGTDLDTKYFLDHTRMFNAKYAFASLEASEVKVKGRGKPIFQLHGIVYYKLAPSLQAPSQYCPSYAQLYTMDPDDGFQHRLDRLLRGLHCARSKAIGLERLSRSGRSPRSAD